MSALEPTGDAADRDGGGHVGGISSRLNPRKDTASLSARAVVSLLLLGIALFATVFVSIARGEDMAFHPGRHIELVATYEAFRETGVPLVKREGSGRPVPAIITGTGFSPAALDDDPGTFLVASYVGRVTSAEEPYRALRLAQAAIAALPWMAIPLVVALLFGRPIVGWTMVGLLPLIPLLSGAGAILGTDYGRVGRYVTLPVYALYGITGSVVFLGLVLALLLATVRLRVAWYAMSAASIGLVAGAAQLVRSGSGIPVLLSGAVVLASFRFRFAVRALAIALAAVVTMAIPNVVMSSVDRARSQLLQMDLEDVPTAHGAWHPLYLGLGYFGYEDGNDGTSNPFGILWSDAFGWERAREVDPDVVIASAEYERIMRNLYLSEVRAKPLAALHTYVAKWWDLIVQQGPVLVFVGLVLLVAAKTRRWRRPLLVGGVVALPAVLFGMLPPTLVFPMRYFFAENTAGLAVFSVVALGWVMSVVLCAPLPRRTGDPTDQVIEVPMRVGRPVADPRLSYVIPTHNYADGIAGTLRSLAGVLEPGRDEIIVVENGSTDETWRELLREAAEWPDDEVALTVLRSRPAVGTAYRVGSLLAQGRNVVLTDDDLPFGVSDLEEFLSVPSGTAIAIGSKAHPGSRVNRSPVRSGASTVFYWLRRLMLNSRTRDSQGSIFVDLAIVQAFARASDEAGYLWTTELVMACESVGEYPIEVPVVLDADHGAHLSRVRLSDAIRALYGLVRLGLRRHLYEDRSWLWSLEGGDRVEPATP